MITAQAHVNAAVGMIGRTYGIGSARLSSFSSYTDCSGAIAVSHRLAGGGEVGAYNSGDLYALCRDHGRIIPFNWGTITPGALLFRPENPLLGRGPLGHVVMVRYPGVTIESRGGYGVGSWPISRLSWSSMAGLLPSVLYGTATAPALAPTIEPEEDMPALVYAPDTFGDTWFLTDGFFARALSSYAEAEELAGSNVIRNLREGGKLRPKPVNGTRLAEQRDAYNKARG